MTPDPEEQEARALRLIDAICGQPEDVEDDPPVDPAALARIDAAIDRAFDHAWRAARAHAKAATVARAQRREDLLTLTRDVIVSRISAMQDRFGPSLQVAHRDLNALSDGDLQSMLADLEELAERRREDR
jgi:hypothetical protein